MKAKLFTDLDKLEVGDRFTLDVLNETFTYEVDQILVTLPEETEELMSRTERPCDALYLYSVWGKYPQAPCPRTPGNRTGRMMEKMRRFTKK